jgi:uncharacterized membrane protein
MIPLIVLIAASGTALLVLRVNRGRIEYTRAAILGMSAMLLFTAMGHFMFTDGMVAMLPDFIPYKQIIVYFTGGIEILAAIGLQIPTLRRSTSLLLILFFMLILPANIKAAVDQLNYQTGANDGVGMDYLWFRVPLQLLFIGWVYVFGVRGKYYQKGNP